MRRILLSVAALLAACGADTATDVLEKAGASLQDVRSGTMSMRMLMEAGQGREVGFSVEGPFSFEGDGPLPEARLEVARIVDGQRDEATFISDGQQARVEAGAVVTAVPPTQVPSLRVGPAGDALPLERWVAEPVMREEGNGAVIRGKANAAVVLTDLFAMAQESGVPSEATTLSAADREHLQAMVRSSRIEVRTQGEDAILRELDLVIELGPHPKLQELTERLGDVTLRFRFTLDDVGRPIQIPQG